MLLKSKTQEDKLMSNWYKVNEIPFEDEAKVDVSADNGYDTHQGTMKCIGNQR